MFKFMRFFALAPALILGLSVLACDPMTGRETPGEYVDDAAVTSKVIAAIVGDPALKKTQIKVETLQSVVQLSGFVDSSSTKRRAGHLARGVDGVKTVKNDLIVR